MFLSYPNRSNYVRGNFSVGKVMLTEDAADVLLLPVVVTTSDVHDFDFSIPVFKSWWVTFCTLTRFLHEIFLTFRGVLPITANRVHGK